MSDFMWIPLLLAVFAIIPAAAIYSVRSITWVYKRVSGKYKIEYDEWEARRQEYLEPDWDSFKVFLRRDPPENMKLLFESPLLADNPIVKVRGEEYFLYPVRQKKNSEPDFWPIGQNDLGESLFLKPGKGQGPLFKHELGPAYEALAKDANEFFREALQQHRERT